MLVGHISSSESKPCVVCGKKTATYKTYEQSNIQIQIPLCDTNDRHCYSDVKLDEVASIAIKLVKKDIPKKK